MTDKLHYGVITDDGISLRGPKMIDDGPFATPLLAFKAAIEDLTSNPCGYAKVVVCKLDDPNSDDPIWVHDWDYPGVEIDATDAEWVCPEEDEDEE